MPVNEGGFNGELVSLAGVRGQPGLGRKMTGTSFIITGGGYIPLANSNQKRISVLITNDGSYGNDPVLIQSSPGGERITVLKAWGTFQIDKDFPWCGALWAQNASAGPTLIVINEIELQ